MDFGGTGWTVWREVLLRTTGFPVDGLEPLRFPDAAAAVDAGEAEAAVARAIAAGARECSRLAADPLLREAVTWQNRGVMVALDRLVREGPDVRYNTDRRQTEEVLARYWQRYCAKNETVGFFGPVCWGSLDLDSRDAVVARPGPGLTRRRRVFFEHWALQAFADAVAADPQARAAFPPRVQPQLTIEGRRVLGPAGRIIELTPAEATVVALCDGRRTAREVAAELGAGPRGTGGEVAAELGAGPRGTGGEPATGPRQAADVYLRLERLVERGVLLWDANLPMTLDAEAVLRARLPQGLAAERFDRLSGLRDEVARAAGDPDLLGKAMAALEAEFLAQTGQQAHRREGQAYAGRTVCHEETARDLDVVIGPGPIAELAPPLAPLLQAARWLTVELARAYDGGLRGLYDELLASGDEVRLSDVWFLAQGILFGPGERPVDAVAAEFTRRWARLFDLDALPPGTRRVELTAEDVARRVDELFPAAAPGWSAGRLHSPDLHLCASSVDAIRAGDFFWVLGELHAGWATFDNSVFTVMHPDPSRLAEALAGDLGRSRVWPLLPVDWPRHTGRVSFSLGAPEDVQLGIAPAPGADPDRLVPAAAMIVDAGADGRLVARAPDGRRWPLLEVFSSLVSMHAVDAFKLVAAREYTPRITIGRLVACRETWRTSTSRLQRFLDARGVAARFVEGRRWRREAGFPERVYFKIGTETKPCYLDFTSPLLVSSACTMLRSAHQRHGDTAVVVSEMLPGPEHAWVPDAQGRRYFSELRLHLVDPVMP
jgi:Lantibiotic dehydratase, N terminus